MKRFDLAEWEIFEAPTGPASALVPITCVWVDYETRRIFGQSPDWPELVWLHPRRVPNRVLRGDSRRPTMRAEDWRALIKRRDAEFATKRKKAKDDEAVDAEALAAMLEREKAVPEPEVRARPATLAEMPQGVRQLGRKAAEHGFRQRVTYARGPRLDQYWRVLETSESFLCKGTHPDGRRFVAWFITKTGQRGKATGVTKWDRDGNYALVQGIWTACNATELALYISDGSLMKET